MSGFGLLRGWKGGSVAVATTCESFFVVALALWAAESLVFWLLRFVCPEFAAWRRAAEISLIVGGLIIGALVAGALAFWAAEAARERRDLARARRCWDRFSCGKGPRAFAREGDEVLAVAVPGVLQALRDIPDLKRRTAYAACCSGARDPRSLPAEWEWAAWPYRYRDRVRVWAFSAPDPEEVEAGLSAAGLKKLPPAEFWRLVEDWRAFLSQGRRVVAERAGAPEAGKANVSPD